LQAIEQIQLVAHIVLVMPLVKRLHMYWARDEKNGLAKRPGEENDHDTHPRTADVRNLHRN
jgi:hypothetical protein